ncbi:hypothetical protein jhhlp_005475 [Lomentospora prolificans]|uniref:Protein kinase domain-containing protein n=1 Tax=Lomentospora prolificans TaxID=41688 RepID=A0A2N3N6Y6_9PEZI|nr:hypothetical protein jhhlp_005475 [Lomentospora prolificans]
MASGLEVLGAVAASLELVKVASACLSTVNELRNVSLQAREQKDAHLNLFIQGLRFERWCSALGIQEVIGTMKARPKDWGEAAEITSFGNTLKKTLRLTSPEFVQLTLAALSGMRDKFIEATGIISKYATTSLHQPCPSSKQNKLSKTLSKLYARRTPSPRTSRDPPGATEECDEQAGKSKSGAALMMKWVTSDKSTIFSLLESIEKTNSLLLELLNPTLHHQVDRRTEMTILYTIHHDTLIKTERLPDVDDLGNMARIKQWQLRERREATGDDATSSSSLTITEDPPPRRIQPYQPKDFKRGTLHYGEYRSLSNLDGQSVMVEWKYYNKDSPVRMEQTLRLGELVGVLNRNNLFKRFATLHCKGLVNDIENSRIGMIFSVDNGKGKQMESLQDMIRREATPIPVGQRFELSKRLATAVLCLHSVQWLHKSIRSDNIICFRGDHELNGPTCSPGGKPSENDKLSRPSRTSSPLRPSLPEFYLVGWDLSRPDHPSELSETLSISTMGFQTKRDAIKSYSHPDIHLEPGTKRPRYRSQFDIYSLGLILLEIGLWRTIDTIRIRSQNDSEFRNKVRTEYCDKLLPKMGEVYWRVVQRCLNNDFGVPEDNADRNDFPLQVSFEEHVVCELEKCFA